MRLVALIRRRPAPPSHDERAALDALGYTGPRRIEVSPMSDPSTTHAPQSFSGHSGAREKPADGDVQSTTA